ncbi:hypothetical protein CAC42_8274 [Sphaceloma murrayae]|uniref:Uncharacterized protein n=1 Tax=Sphaceloma murrayae TaxID=2082308 RepID=A0A2K1QK89_9PEZI|nr:hypothetical protein CAC42_8274 [Sphaceloma murrayae]
MRSLSPVHLLAFAAFSFLCTLLSRRSRHLLLSRLRPVNELQTHTHHNDAKATTTSPPSPKRSELEKTFPPERLSAHCANPSLVAARQQALLDPSNCVPLDGDIYDPKHANKLTPTGFSVAEINAIVDLPDYGKLSGVPLPEPLPNFDITKAKPRPYRPFRWPYHQTMSLSKLDTSFWLELDSTYPARIAQRISLYNQHGSSILASLPGSHQAVSELLHNVLLFLSTRYPNSFTLTPTSFTNHILSTTAALPSPDPLLVLLHHVPEDFAIMLRCPTTGLYHLRAGVICSSLGWSLSDKLGLPLSSIHSPIPHYASKMSFSMDRYFARLPSDRPIQRGSWGLEVGEPLFVPRDSPVLEERSRRDPDLDVADVKLRVDWQTLRRLPVSAAIVFNFKALFTPLEELRGEKGVPGLVEKVLREGDGDMLKYKGSWYVEHVVLPKLAEWRREQEEKGLGIGEIATLDESPFFEGWEEKWMTAQGSSGTEKAV